MGGKRWGEFVSGGSRDPTLQRLALLVLDMQHKHGFSLFPVWRPREENVRADYLSRVSEMRHHGYSIRALVFKRLDARWGPHTVDRFATQDNCQPLQAPYTGRFCAQYFHPDALWTDTLTASWGKKINWVFPPVHMIGQAITALRDSKARGTLIVPKNPLAQWWFALKPRGGQWALDISDAICLGPSERVLKGVTPEYRAIWAGRDVMAIRFVCR